MVFGQTPIASRPLGASRVAAPAAAALRPPTVVVDSAVDRAANY